MKKSKNQKLAELVNLAMTVNNESKYCVFMYMMGHVDSLKIDIRESKKEYHTEVATSEFYFNTNDLSFDQRYHEIKKVLVSILKNGKIDYDSLDREERIEYDYHF